MSHVEYAVSGRAGCKACGQKIAAQDVRVGEEREGDWGTFMAWKHLHCAYRRGVRSAQPSGLSRLSAEDQQLVRDFCAGLGPAAEAPLSLADAVAALSPPRLAAPSPAASQPPHASPLASQPPLLSDAEGESEEERAAREVLFGTLQSDIVGVRYYSGTVHAGEYVSIVREPRNAYDANACRVDNLAGTQVGHIRRQLAAALAPLMDDSSHMRPRLEGSIPRPSSNDFSIPILLSVYGLAEVAPAVAALLARYGARFDPGSGIAAGTAASVVATRTIAAASRTQEELDALLDTLSETDGLTPFDAAVEAPALTTRLHDYQAAGVAWMLRRERDPDGVVSAAGLPPFWQRVQERGATAYLNTITNSSHAMPPPPVYGGLLADDMGLGKSVQVIATILAHVRAFCC
jgi:SWI/SNF-related matrix-associated actin-dependent regulator of chromatin subfamily A3